MTFIAIALLGLATFGICFLVDKGFTKLFRGKKEHRSGRAVRLSKRYGSVGLIVAVLGVPTVFAGIGLGWIIPTGGVLLILLGIGLITYYMTFGVFYDDESFILTTFGRKSTTYQYRDIQSQQLFNSYGNIVIELHMKDGRTVQLSSAMDGMYPFLDHAFSAWLRQTNRRKEDCAFYDPDNSCWFPSMEV